MSHCRDDEASKSGVGPMPQICIVFLECELVLYPTNPQDIPVLVEYALLSNDILRPDQGTYTRHVVKRGWSLENPWQPKSLLES